MSRFAARVSVLVGLSACSSTSFDVGETPDTALEDATADNATALDGAEDTSRVSDSTAIPDTGTGSDTAVPDSGLTDSTGTPDTGTPDTGTPDTGTPDTGTPDTGTPDIGPPADTGCTPGTTVSCECGGVRKCDTTGTLGACTDVCLPSPARFICAYGKSGCTTTTCFDSNNCVAKCKCVDAPGSVCSLSDACWGVVCNGYVCPS